jgi:hypothetical protein
MYRGLVDVYVACIREISVASCHLGEGSIIDQSVLTMFRDTRCAVKVSVGLQEVTDMSDSSRKTGSCIITK